MSSSTDNKLKAMLDATQDCPGTDELASLMETGQVAQDAHVKQCSHCQSELALLDSFLNPAVAAAEQPHVDAIVRRLRKNSPAAATPWWKQLLTPRAFVPALAAAALALVVVVNLEHRPGPVVLMPSNEVMRSQSIESIAPQGDLAQVPEVLAWTPVAGAATYRVRLMEVDRTLLWTGSTTAAKAILPENVRARITPLKALLWDVSAVSGSGTVIATSGIHRFRLQDRP